MAQSTGKNSIPVLLLLNPYTQACGGGGQDRFCKKQINKGSGTVIALFSFIPKNIASQKNFSENRVHS